MDTIKDILDATPANRMTLKEYQEKTIPQFLQHLKEKNEALFNEFFEKYPKYQNLLGKLSNIGRKALVHTVTPNIGEFKDIHDGLWTWDGEYLNSTNSKASFMVTDEFSEIRLKPNQKAVVEIMKEEQVNENTQFVT